MHKLFPAALAAAALSLGSCCHCPCDCKDQRAVAPAPAVPVFEAAPILAHASVASAEPVVASDARKIPLGINGSLAGVRLLASSSAWNQPVDGKPLDPRSAEMIAGIGADAPLHPDFGTEYHGSPWGIPYVVVAGDTPRTDVQFDYDDESDKGPYPIPADLQIEGSPRGKIPEGDDNDQHLLIVDRDHAKLYELYLLHRNGTTWKAGSGAIWDLLGDTQRTAGWTSADAGGLPILPGLVRYDEVVTQGKIEHALRFTTKNTRKAYTAPATHWASKKTDTNLPPMGAHLRLKASVRPEDFPAQVRPIIVALKKYGMILADNGGSLFLSGAPNPGWRDDDIEALKKLHGRDFEVVQLGRVVTP